MEFLGRRSLESVRGTGESWSSSGTKPPFADAVLCDRYWEKQTWALHAEDDVRLSLQRAESGRSALSPWRKSAGTRILAKKCLKMVEKGLALLLVETVS